MDWSKLEVAGRVTALARGLCAGVGADGDAFVVPLRLPHPCGADVRRAPPRLLRRARESRRASRPGSPAGARTVACTSGRRTPTAACFDAVLARGDRRRLGRAGARRRTPTWSSSATSRRRRPGGCALHQRDTRAPRRTVPGPPDLVTGRPIRTRLWPSPSSSRVRSSWPDRSASPAPRRRWLWAAGRTADVAPDPPGRLRPTALCSVGTGQFGRHTLGRRPGGWPAGRLPGPAVAVPRAAPYVDRRRAAPSTWSRGHSTGPSCSSTRCSGTSRSSSPHCRGGTGCAGTTARSGRRTRCPTAGCARRAPRAGGARARRPGVWSLPIPPDRLRSAHPASCAPLGSRDASLGPSCLGSSRRSSTSPDRGPRELGPRGVTGCPQEVAADGQGRGERRRGGGRHPGRRDARGRRLRAVRHPVGADRRAAGRRAPTT